MKYFWPSVKQVPEERQFKFKTIYDVQYTMYMYLKRYANVMGKV